VPAWWIFSRPVNFALEYQVQNRASSTGGLWIFPQPVDFSTRNLHMMWTDNDLKKKENKRKRKRGNG